MEKQLNEGIKVNLTVNLLDGFGDTKAIVKTGWSDGDVVFVFFKGVGVAETKYLKLVYDGTTGVWESAAFNGLVAADLINASDKRMTAVFLPYGSMATVAYDGEDCFVFQDGDGTPLDYKGFFLQDQLVDYSYDTELKGTLNLGAPNLSEVTDKLIHFDISGFISGHRYSLYQEFVKPLSFGGVSTGGIVSKKEGLRGQSITGYEHSAEVMSFSGILDSSSGAVGEEMDYQFSIWDDTDSILYVYDAGERKVDKNQFIGIGDITTWTSFVSGVDFEYLGFNNAYGQRIMWAKRNLGATAISGEGSYGDYFAWGDTSGYRLAGLFGAYSGVGGNHDFSTNPYYELDANGNLKQTHYDAAHVVLKGLWRMPTREEFALLINKTKGPYSNDPGDRSFTFGNSSSGMTFVSTVNGAVLFLPAAGSISGIKPFDQGFYGFYWSSTECNENNAFELYFDYGGDVESNTSGINSGKPIRPVFSVD